MTAICILGIRGGTSTVAGLLRQLGVNLGPDELLLAPHENNPKGYFELGPFLAINLLILHRYGGDWDMPPVFPDGWVYQCADLEKQAREDTRNIFGQSPIWAFKDPRCCLTFPFWSHTIGSDMKCIIVIRNPLDTARSLDAIHQIGVQKASELWFEYLSKAFLYSKEHQRLVVFYEDIISDIDEQASLLSDFIETKKPINMDAVNAFVSPELRHYRSSYDQVMKDTRISNSIKQVYADLVRVKSSRLTQSRWSDMMGPCFHFQAVPHE